MGQVIRFNNIFDKWRNRCISNNVALAQYQYLCDEVNNQLLYETMLKLEKAIEIIKNNEEYPEQIVQNAIDFMCEDF